MSAKHSNFIDIFKSIALPPEVRDMTLVQATENWFVKVKQMPEQPTPDVRKTAFYTGMQLEEMSEKLDVFFPDGNPFVDQLKAYATQFKDGAFDVAVQTAMMSPAKCKELLDCDVDVLWVTIGHARAMGSDINTGYKKVIGANYAKRFEDGTFHLAPNGKVLKPEGWKPADLTDCLHPSLQQGFNGNT